MDGKFKNIIDKIGKEKGLKIIVFVGIIGMILILMSEFIPKSSDQSVDKVTKENDETFQFQKQTEAELIEILSEITGVGKVKVMVTFSGSEEYIFAEEEKLNRISENEKKTQQSENKFVVIDKNGERQALVKKVLTPQIKGVVVVCEGGGNANTRERIYMAVATALEVPIGKIYVTK